MNSILSLRLSIKHIVCTEVESPNFTIEFHLYHYMASMNQVNFFLVGRFEMGGLNTNQTKIIYFLANSEKARANCKQWQRHIEWKRNASSTKIRDTETIKLSILCTHLKYVNGIITTLKLIRSRKDIKLIQTMAGWKIQFSSITSIATTLQHVITSLNAEELSFSLCTRAWVLKRPQSC